MRPPKLEDVIGNAGAKKVVESLLNRDLESLPAGVMFTGPPGCGKTTLARILRNHMKDCDFIELNGSSERGINTIRQIAESASASLFNNSRIYFFDEAHRLTVDAENALLKILEEPPDNMFFFFATTNPEQILEAIRSRCVQIKVTTLTSRDMIPYLKKVAELEGIDDLPEDVFKEIFKASGGALRNALKILDIVLDIEELDDVYEVIKDGVPDEEGIYEFVKMIINPVTTWDKIAAQVRIHQKSDSEGVRLQILAILNGYLLNSGKAPDPLIGEIIECFKDNYYASGKTGLSLSCAQAFYVHER